MAVSVKYYTNRFISLAILIVMAVWALLFYAILMDEVYDNIDDGLKNQKIEIIRAAYADTTILHKSVVFGINQFVIKPAKTDGDNLDKNSFSREFIYMPYDEEDEPYRVLRTGFYSNDGKPYDLEIRTSTVEEDDYLINLAISLTVLYIVIIISIIVINHFVLNRAWKPFRQVLDNLSKYRFGSSRSYEPVKTEVIEFGELNDQIAQMIDRNERVFDDQKRFLENASHELQTPLAATIGKLELLLQDDLLTKDQLLRITEAKQSLHRMVSLNKSLLMLSRIENNQYVEKEKVQFNRIIHDLDEELEDMVAFKKYKLILKDLAVFEMEINANLAQILLSNLIRNAIKYSHNEGDEIVVTIEKDCVSISNEGGEGGALNPAYIFDRFYKGKQDNYSNGLGLSIVQSILQQTAKLKLSYVFENNRHIFRLNK